MCLSLSQSRLLFCYLSASDLSVVLDKLTQNNFNFNIQGNVFVRVNISYGVSFSDDEFVIGPCRSTATHDNDRR